MSPSLQPRIPGHVRLIPGCAASLVALAAGLVLIGWAIDSEFLKSLRQPVSMNPMTSLAFLLAACALWFSRSATTLPKHVTLARLLALSVAAIALARLIGLVPVLDVGIDRILFHDELAGNRMAPNTALNFLLTGLGLTLLDTKVLRVRPAPLLLGCAAAISLLALTGYAYATLSFYAVANYIPMALNTAAAFVALEGYQPTVKATSLPPGRSDA